MKKTKLFKKFTFTVTILLIFMLNVQVNFTNLLSPASQNGHFVQVGANEAWASAISISYSFNKPQKYYHPTYPTPTCGMSGSVSGYIDTSTRTIYISSAQLNADGPTSQKIAATFYNETTGIEGIIILTSNGTINNKQYQYPEETKKIVFEHSASYEYFDGSVTRSCALFLYGNGESISGIDRTYLLNNEPLITITSPTPNDTLFPYITISERSA